VHVKICEFITLEMSCSKSTYLRTHLLFNLLEAIGYMMHQLV